MSKIEDNPVTWPRRLGSWIGWSKWMTAALVLCALAGAGIAFGLSAEELRLPLLLGLVFLVTTHFSARIYRIYRLSRRPKPAPDNSTAARFGRGFGKTFGVAMGVTIFALFVSESQQLKRLRSSNEVAELHVSARNRARDAKGAEAEAYWNASVYQLYVTNPLDPKADVHEIHKQQTAQLERLMDEINDLPTTDVPADLVAMVQRHVSQITTDMAKVMELKQSLAQQSTTEKQPPYTLEQAEPLMEQLLQSAERGDTERVPPALRPLVDAILELESTADDQFREAEIMQARLQERYPRQEFALPPQSAQ